MNFESGPLQAAIRRDLEFNKKLAKNVKEYWKGMGHEVEVTITFNGNINIYELRSDKVNGLPLGGLTKRAKSKLAI